LTDARNDEEKLQAARSALEADRR
jgi:hypothetical protein